MSPSDIETAKALAEEGNELYKQNALSEGPFASRNILRASSLKTDINSHQHVHESFQARSYELQAVEELVFRVLRSRAIPTMPTNGDQSHQI
jgi:hypothetical protein